uniref:Candidate secreted effector n=1 Tax=Meloidogyne incognita TaxID=6306 RepID=A0A914KL43_MELIC
MSSEKNYVPDLKNVDSESVPTKEKEIKKTHPGRPDLDYDEAPVGPAEGYVEQKESQK